MSARRWLVRAALLVLVLASCELMLNFLLFSSVARGWSFARALRRPELYADSQRSDLYWELQDRWVDPAARAPAPVHDAELGWRSRWVEPVTYEHVESALSVGKRPILLFGDSYAQCNTPPDECFQSLLASSGLGRKYHLLNFGVGGYGLDQVLLLMPRVLERYQERKPIVLVGVMVDDDLDRCRLSFRCWPKPHFELDGEQLTLRGTPVPTLEQYRAPWRGSLLVRLFAHGLMPRSLSSKLERRGPFDRATAALGSRIVERLVDELQARQIDTLFVLFRAEPSTRALSSSDWRDHAVRDVLDRRGVPWVDIGEVLRNAANANAISVGNYFGGSPELAGHYNALGNRVAFEGIVTALRERFGVEFGLPPLSPAAISAKRLPDAQSAARHEFGLRHPFTMAEYERLCLRVGAAGPTEIDYEVLGGELRFSADARLIPLENVAAGSVGLKLLGDSRELARFTLRRGEPQRRVEVDLRGVRRLTIHADDAGDGCEGDWLVLAMPRFE